MLGLALPGVASAGFWSWGCPYQGTWFGVMENSPALAGWMVTVEGKSHFYGTNNLEFTATAFDPRLPDPVTGAFAFPNAVQATTMRGNWMRTGYNTFVYTTTGFALNADGNPEYIVKLSGHIKLRKDCNSNVITGTLEIFFPWTMKNPFIDKPDLEPIPIENVYGYRAFVDLP